MKSTREIDTATKEIEKYKKDLLPYIIKGIENWVEIAWKNKWLNKYSFGWYEDEVTESILYCLLQHKKHNKDLIRGDLQINGYRSD